MVWGSVSAPTLEGFEHQVAHRADVGFDAFQPIGIVVAIFGALAIDAVAFLAEFAIEAGKHGVVGEGPACDCGQ